MLFHCQCQAFWNKTRFLNSFWVITYNDSESWGERYLLSSSKIVDTPNTFPSWNPDKLSETSTIVTFTFLQDKWKISGRLIKYMDLSWHSLVLTCFAIFSSGFQVETCFFLPSPVKLMVQYESLFSAVRKYKHCLVRDSLGQTSGIFHLLCWQDGWLDQPLVIRSVPGLGNVNRWL